MVTLSVSIEDLLKAKKKGRKEQTLELEADAHLEEPVIIQSGKLMDVKQIGQRYKVCLKGRIYDEAEDISKHVRSLGLGYDRIMIQVGDFPRRDNIERKPVHIDFLGIDSFTDSYDFGDFIYDYDGSINVETNAITGYTTSLGPVDNAFNPLDYFDYMRGYMISASIPDRLDGRAKGLIIVDVKNRRIAQAVHKEVLTELQKLCCKNPQVKDASTKALRQAYKKSAFRNKLIFHNWS